MFKSFKPFRIVNLQRVRFSLRLIRPRRMRIKDFHHEAHEGHEGNSCLWLLL
jgi:hypothetical protein